MLLSAERELVLVYIILKLFALIDFPGNTEKIVRRRATGDPLGKEQSRGLQSSSCLSL